MPSLSAPPEEMSPLPDAVPHPSPTTPALWASIAIALVLTGIATNRRRRFTRFTAGDTRDDLFSRFLRPDFRNS